MSFDQSKYIAEYNKEKYKMYQFRVKKDSELIKKLDDMDNRNSYIVSLIEKDLLGGVLTLKKIKSTIKPILNKYGIKEIYLFGSYARGEATAKSDVDIYCERGNFKSFYEEMDMIEELEKGLGKKVDILFLDMELDEYFYSVMKEDLIKLC